MMRNVPPIIGGPSRRSRTPDHFRFGSMQLKKFVVVTGEP
jgi:hypothetical protein